MDMKITVTLSAAAVAVIGFAVLSFGNDDEAAQESDPLVVAQTSLKSETAPVEPTEAQKGFQSMAVDAGDPVECSLPKPLKSIGETALTRNSLRQVLRILALQKWQETRSCDCFYDKVSWDDVVNAAPDFERTDGVNLRFDLSSLRTQGDQLEAQRLKVCSE